MAQQNKDYGLGYECHDCGETFEPGESTAPCTEQGHYVGPITACELPFLRPAKSS